MLNPQGRVVMVSGASGGIGRAVLDRLLAAGCVISAGLRAPGRMAAHDRLSCHGYDATAPGCAEAWAAATASRHGRIDAVVNVAGINTRGTLLEGEAAAFDACFAVNAKAPMAVIRAAWPHLVASGTGRVVTVTSLSGKRVRNDNLAYAMSKFAAMALNQEVRRLGWEHGIRGTALGPGFVATGMTAHVTKLPREQMSRPGDVAAVIDMLLHLPNTASVAELLLNCRHEDTL